MSFFLILLGIALAACGAYLWHRRRRVRNLLAQRLTDAERDILHEFVPAIAQLPADLANRLEGKMIRFLDQVTFYAAGDLGEITDEMQISIAAQACLLIVNSDAWYKNLRTIILYPGAFTSQQPVRDGYVVHHKRTIRLGESWSRGPVVLSWPHSEQGGRNFDDGHNVVLHEFAHQLDDLNGFTDGLPILRRGQGVRQWEQVFVDAYDRHCDRVERGKRTAIDAYGATGPEEFFAVSIELFFEKPDALNEAEQAVYAQIKQLLRLDPLTWR